MMAKEWTDSSDLLPAGPFVKPSDIATAAGGYSPEWARERIRDGIISAVSRKGQYRVEREEAIRFLRSLEDDDAAG